ncbi:uncharacterized protein B0J16DRAFT_318852 [Fusarium flagelliforme]|uniref:uncharacterized protein n=1 Tax=Fusarium flagelliforme TaxID=2675880 RepID=UPI001E8CA48C|nr:uncharacterized protein B0J16DRAFT_318852 [Fusarium flagelliforme]KAH7189216.1 hypothetical protein B0J16DRAFT_318852 [Fusarium flagelliforme]
MAVHYCACSFLLHLRLLLFLRDKEACLHAAIGYPYLKPQMAVFPSHHSVLLTTKGALRSPLTRSNSHSPLLYRCRATYRDYLMALTLNYAVPESRCSAGATNLSNAASLDHAPAGQCLHGGTARALDSEVPRHSQLHGIRARWSPATLNQA